MTKSKLYLASFSYRQSSVLPPELQSLVPRLSRAVLQGEDCRLMIAEFRKQTALISASAALDAFFDIKTLGKLGDPNGPNSDWKLNAVISRLGNFTSGFTAIASRRDREVIALKANPLLGYFFLSSADGHVREAALHSIALPPETEFEFTAIIHRLNDWAAPVRNAAIGCMERLSNKTEPEVIAKAAVFLMPQVNLFQRWTDVQARVAEDAFFRKDVLAALEQILVKTSGAALRRVFEHLVRRPDFDGAIVKIWREAATPGIRALALEALLTRKVKWFTGYDKQWIHKTYNYFRSVAKFNYRDFDHTIPIDELILGGAQDRSAKVRKLVADYLIDNKAEANQFMDRIATELLRDKNASVRSRAEYYCRRQT